MSVIFGPRIDPTCAICYNDLADPEYFVDVGIPGQPDMKSDLFSSPCHGHHTFHYACAKHYFEANRLARQATKCPYCRELPEWQAADFPADPGLEERQAAHAAQERERQENADRMEAIRLQESDIRARQQVAVEEAEDDDTDSQHLARRLADMEYTRVAAIRHEIDLRNLLESRILPRFLYSGRTRAEADLQGAIDDGLNVNLGLVIASGWPDSYAGVFAALDFFITHGADVNAVVNTRPPSLTDSGRGVSPILESPLSRARDRERHLIEQWLLDHGAVSS